ncbi:hypothetical protein TWF594_006980 [Orbilia oligospora]|nr:hypothetical protein TWF103_001292 [Orbilia oligospora]KAF3087921.1 hypothetical protein TWF103_001292 [Orbilia oligospora]KAF3151330.1 hypothetical protein TWF594_006980 [Orbilia oligospora]
MRYSSIILAMGLGLATSVTAQVETARIIGCNDDNCLRALKNAQRTGAFQECISFSSAILNENPVTETVTSTTTEVATTITPGAGGTGNNNKRDFVNFNRRDVQLPSYAPDKCVGSVSARYWSACSCLIRSSSRIGITVTIPTVTVTATSWSTIPATATALATNAPPFMISFVDENIKQYLSMQAEESGESGAQDVIFTSDSEKAVQFKVVADGKLADVATKKIIHCDTAGTPVAFTCAFFDSQQESIAGKAPMKCARTGISELKCSIPTGDYPVRAILGGGTRRMRRKLQRRADETPKFGILPNAEALAEFIEAGINIVGALLNSIDATNPQSSTTTASSEPTAPATTTSLSETTTTTATTESESDTSTTTAAPPSSTTEPEESETTTTAPSSTTSEEPEPTTTAPSSTTSEEPEPTTAAPSSTTSEEPEPTTTVPPSSTIESEGSTTTTTPAPQSTTTEPDEEPEIPPIISLA